MFTGKTQFAQVMDFLPWTTFHRIVARYDGDQRVRTLTCAEQYRAMAFAQFIPFPDPDIDGPGMLRAVRAPVMAFLFAAVDQLDKADGPAVELGEHRLDHAVVQKCRDRLAREVGDVQRERGPEANHSCQ